MVKDEKAIKEEKKYKRYGTILYYILSILSKTLRIKVVKNENIKENEEHYIFVFWHNKLIAPSICLKNIEKRAVLASPSKDGELISIPLEKMGFYMIRGSSDKNSTSSLIALLKMLKKGYSIGTPVDGPKGPIYEVKPGLIYLSLKSNKKIIPIGVAFEKKWIFKRAWDKFEFPKPFSKVLFYMGKPIELSEDIEIETHCNNLKNILIEMEKTANEYLKGDK